MPENSCDVAARLLAAPQKEVSAYIKDLWNTDDEVLEALVADSRLKVAESAAKALLKKRQEIDRLNGMMKYENALYDKGVQYIAGVDEAGRGPLAGPVVAAAVILPRDCYIPGLNDSKKISEKKRYELEEIVKEKAIAWGIGIVSAEEIDRVNILQATFGAMRTALSYLQVEPQHILADAVTIPGCHTEQTAIVHGDALSVSIAAASILAKCHRDRMMYEYDKLYPQYGFAGHKGYGTAAHLQAIADNGHCPIHRRSFMVKDMSAFEKKAAAKKAAVQEAAPVVETEEVPW